MRDIQQMNTEKHVVWADCIRIAATFAVVWLHTVTSFPLSIHSPVSYRWTVYLYNSMLRMCVPLFFMLSGYLLLGKREATTTYFIKRINRVVIPTAAWTVIYIFWKAYYVEHSIITVYSFWSAAFVPVYPHFWYLYAIIGIYLYLPILRIIIQNADDTILYYFVALWFFAVSVVPIFEQFTSVEHSMIDLEMISGYIGYLVIGYLLGRKTVSKKTFWTMLIVALGSAGASAIGSFELIEIQKKGNFTNYFTWYLNPAVILLSVSTFLVFKHFFENMRPLRSVLATKTIKILSSASFGIYIVHVMFLYHLCKGDFGIEFSVFPKNPLYSTPMIAALTFTASFILVFILQKIPIVKKMVP